jgi:hypothetical protein
MSTLGPKSGFAAALNLSAKNAASTGSREGLTATCRRFERHWLHNREIVDIGATPVLTFDLPDPILHCGIGERAGSRDKALEGFTMPGRSKVVTSLVPTFGITVTYYASEVQASR